MKTYRVKLRYEAEEVYLVEAKDETLAEERARQLLINGDAHFGRRIPEQHLDIRVAEPIVEADPKFEADWKEDPYELP